MVATRIFTGLDWTRCIGQTLTINRSNEPVNFYGLNAIENAGG
jgi:hypothetical protein